MQNEQLWELRHALESAAYLMHQEGRPALAALFAEAAATIERLAREVEELKRSLDFRMAVAYDCGARAALQQGADDGQ